MRRKRVGFVSVLIFIIFAVPVYAAAPLAVVENNVNKVLDVLRDPRLKAPAAKEEKAQRLRVIYNGMFNEVEFSRRTLGRNWNQFTPAQRTEFIELFKQVLEKAYLDKILSYTNEKIEYSREIIHSDRLAEVQTKIVTASQEIPIFYRLVFADGNWKVYDVVVENVSLVQNYRTQFNDILAKNNPEHLLEILRKRVKEQQ